MDRFLKVELTRPDAKPDMAFVGKDSRIIPRFLA